MAAVGKDQRSEGISRRGLLGGAAAGAGGLALGGLAGAEAAGSRRRRVDVAVVGAGLAGLAAARDLKRAGASFVVLEARDRVGGRTLNHPIRGGEVVEIGGQWVGPTQDRALQLIDRLGLRIYDTYVDGSNVYYRDGNLQTYTGTIPPANPASLVELQLVITQLDLMAAEIPPEAPWQAPNAVAWDGQTFETWKLAHATTGEARDLIDLAVQAVFAAEARELSLLHVLFYVRAAGSFENLINTAGGAQESRVVGGSQLIAKRLARQVGHVELGAAVRRIRRGRGGVTLETDRGEWRARRAIVAVPPTLAGRIVYSPKLPGGRDQLTQRVPMGSVVKCMAVYRKPFWRDAGMSGMATSDTGPVKLTFDNTPPDGRPGVLLGFVEGQEAREFTRLTRRKRRAAVLECFERYFGPEARTDVVQYVDKSWAEDAWSRGCYVGLYPPGVLTGFGPEIRRPVGPLHWAGTETATVWNGYMDGAIESGQRAAAEVLEEL